MEGTEATSVGSLSSETIDGQERLVSRYETALYPSALYHVHSDCLTQKHFAMQEQM